MQIEGTLTIKRICKAISRVEITVILCARKVWENYYSRHVSTAFRRLERIDALQLSPITLTGAFFCLGTIMTTMVPIPTSLGVPSAPTFV